MHPERSILWRLRAVVGDLRIFAWMAREAAPRRPRRGVVPADGAGRILEPRSFGEVWDHPV
jgi:hypothetical protein